MNPADEKLIGAIKVLRLMPDDVVIVRPARQMTRLQAAQLLGYMTDALPGRKVLVLDPDIEVTTSGAEPEGSAAGSYHHEPTSAEANPVTPVEGDAPAATAQGTAEGGGDGAGL